MESKKPWLSKTLILNAIVAVLALAWPAGQAFVASHPDYVVSGFAAINFILRLVTKQAIGLSD